MAIRIGIGIADIKWIASTSGVAYSPSPAIEGALLSWGGGGIGLTRWIKCE